MKITKRLFGTTHLHQQLFCPEGRGFNQRHADRPFSQHINIPAPIPDPNTNLIDVIIVIVVGFFIIVVVVVEGMV